MATEDVSKLPQWAQRRIAKLEADVESYNARLMAMDAGDTRVKINRFDDDDIHLPDGARIAFVVPGGEIRVYLTRGSVEVSTDEGRIVVRPNVSNSVYVGLEKP